MEAMRRLDQELQAEDRAGRVLHGSKFFLCDVFTAPHPACELQCAHLKIAHLSSHLGDNLIARFLCFDASLDLRKGSLPTTPTSLTPPRLVEVVEYGTARNNTFFLETGTEGHFDKIPYFFGVGERVGTLSISASVLLRCVEHGKQWEVNALG